MVVVGVSDQSDATLEWFFPPTPEKIAQFCQMILDDSHLIDILGCWTYGERKILPYLEEPELVHLRCIEPFGVQCRGQKP